jgi:PhzF family phenazine biosynthesis protein
MALFFRIGLLNATMSMILSIYQVDAFTQELFKGNPAAVVPLDEWIGDEIMQHIAAENNLSETAFFKSVNNDCFHIRWFTPLKEVDLCGHATLASAHVLFYHEKYPRNPIKFQSKKGLLIVTKSRKRYQMDFPADHVTSATDPGGIIFSSIGIKPKEIYRGADDYLAILGSEKDVISCQPDFRELSRLQTRGLIISAPGTKVDFVSRGFFPRYGIDEDPVTGSAHTLLTPYWSKRFNKTDLSAIQMSKRRGHLHCAIKEDRVLITGRAITYLKGTISI